MVPNQDFSQDEFDALPADIVRQLTHEGRNTLQRSQAALERLRWRLAEQPELTELLARVESAHGELVGLCDAAQELMGPMHLRRAVCDLAEVWREARARAPAARRLELEEHFAPADLRCEVDRARLAQVFHNLLRYMLAAGDGPLRGAVSADDTRLADRPALQFTLRGDRPATAEELRPHFLPLAVAHKIVTAHEGRLFPGGGPGLSFVLQLPRSAS